MQPSQSRLPVFSLMVLSETKAGYSVSHGTCMVRPILWAGGRREVETEIEVNSDVNCFVFFLIKCTLKTTTLHADPTKVNLIFVKYTNKAASLALVLRYLQLRCRSCDIAGTLLPPRGYQKCCMQQGVTTFLLGQYSHKSMLIKTQADLHKLMYFFISFIENFHLSTSVFFLQLLFFFFFTSRSRFLMI